MQNCAYSMSAAESNAGDVVLYVCVFYCFLWHMKRGGGTCLLGLIERHLLSEDLVKLADYMRGGGGIIASKLRTFYVILSSRVRLLFVLKSWLKVMVS